MRKLILLLLVCGLVFWGGQVFAEDEDDSSYCGQSNANSTNCPGGGSGSAADQFEQGYDDGYETGFGIATGTGGSKYDNPGNSIDYDMGFAGGMHDGAEDGEDAAGDPDTDGWDGGPEDD